jgi:hypothetical protein
MWPRRLIDERRKAVFACVSDRRKLSVSSRAELIATYAAGEEQ